MYLMTYSRSGGEYVNSWDNSSWDESTNAIICGDRFQAKAMAALINEVDVFNIVMAQGSLAALTDFCDGEVTLEKMSYLASLDADPTEADLAELALITQYKGWVSQKRQEFSAKLAASQINKTIDLITTEGFETLAAKVCSDVERVKQAVAKELEKVTQILFSDAESEPLRELLTLEAQASVLVHWPQPVDGERFDFPYDEELYAIAHKWHNELVRLQYDKPIEDDDDDYSEEYYDVSIKMVPFTLPANGTVIIGSSSSSSYYCD